MSLCFSKLCDSQRKTIMNSSIIPHFTIQPPPKNMKTIKNEIVPTPIVSTNNTIKIDVITLPVPCTQFEMMNNMPSLESTDQKSTNTSSTTLPTKSSQSKHTFRLNILSCKTTNSESSQKYPTITPTTYPTAHPTAKIIWICITFHTNY